MAGKRGNGKTKTNKQTKAKGPRDAKAGDNKPPRTFDEERALFLSHNRVMIDARAKVNAAKAIELDALMAAKADGFDKKDFDIARDLAAGHKPEAKVETDVRRRLRVARFVGHKLGEQYDLFELPDRTPAVDRAYDAGKQASMENKPRKPPHAPESEQYAAWIAGYNAHQETIMSGFKAPPSTDADGDEIKSGTFVPRSAFSKAALDAGVIGPESEPAAPPPLPPTAQEESEL
jgi:hypothetical protein